jgi:predicted negative regulator of RcsB-dependent stress response
MDSQDTGTLFLFKLWTAAEANKNRLAAAIAAIVVVILVILFFSWQKDQKEINAGQAYSQFLVSVPNGDNPADLAPGLLQVADQYPATEAGQRAQLQAAADLFVGGKYADAQTQFQKFSDANPNSAMIAIAELGLAATQEALGKTDAALAAYKNIINNYSDITAQIPAKFALGRISDEQGHPADAIRYYDEVAHSVSGSTLGQQAALKSAELKASLPAVAPSFAPAAAAPTPTPTPTLQLHK